MPLGINEKIPKGILDGIDEGILGGIDDGTSGNVPGIPGETHKENPEINLGENAG